MGEASKELLLLRESAEGGVDTERGERSAETINTFEEEKPINMWGLSVTPVFTDHAAYDSYIFLISGEGKNILHFGDAHLHGYDGGYSKLVEAFGPDLIMPNTFIMGFSVFYQYQSCFSLRSRELMRFISFSDNSKSYNSVFSLI